MEFEALLNTLDARKSGDGFIARCPAHEDRTPSLSISKPNGRILLHCHAGCEQQSVIDALKARGLWDESTATRKAISAQYDYTDAAGELVFQVVRYAPKDFRQRRPDGAGGWIWNLQGVKRVLYNLPSLLAAVEAGETIAIAEGEKDVHALRDIGITATTNCGGAGKWRAEYSATLKDAHVVILPDNDEPGRAHAAQVRAALEGIAASVKTINLPGLPEKGDVADWIAAGGTGDSLLALIEAAPKHEPAPELAEPEPPESEFPPEATLEKPRGEDAGEWPSALNLSELAARDPEQPKSIMHGLPVGYAALISGHGGVGKSAIALHLGVCVALGIPFFGLPVERRRVMYLSCEDREGILHWRLSRICAFLGVDLASLKDWLQVIDLVGHDAVLWDRDPRTGYTVTPGFAQLAERVRQYGTQLLIVDGTSDTFAGNENSRTEVKRYVNAAVGLVPPDDGAVLLIGHVDKAAARSGETSQGYSGSTAWHNSVRARWYLRPETSRGDEAEGNEQTGNLILELQKSNLGRADLEMRFAWDADAHLFVGQPTTPLSHFDRGHRDRTEQEAILRAFAACAAAVPPVIVPAAMTGPRTAYHVLKARPELPETLRAGKPSIRRFWAQIEQLRHMRAIEERSYRRESNRHTGIQLALTQEGMRRCV